MHKFLLMNVELWKSPVGENRSLSFLLFGVFFEGCKEKKGIPFLYQTIIVFFFKSSLLFFIPSGFVVCHIHQILISNIRNL